MDWFWKKKTEDRVDHTEADQARARAAVDKSKADAKWIDVHDTLRLIEPNGFGMDLRDRMRARKKKTR